MQFTEKTFVGYLIIMSHDFTIFHSISDFVKPYIHKVVYFVTHNFYCAMHTLVHLRGLGIACRPSVCLSVRL